MQWMVSYILYFEIMLSLTVGCIERTRLRQAGEGGGRGGGEGKREGGREERRRDGGEERRYGQIEVEV